jgi:hypothetical protein
VVADASRRRRPMPHRSLAWIDHAQLHTFMQMCTQPSSASSLRRVAHAVPSGLAPRRSGL